MHGGGNGGKHDSHGCQGGNASDGLVHLQQHHPDDLLGIIASPLLSAIDQEVLVIIVRRDLKDGPVRLSGGASLHHRGRWGAAGMEGLQFSTPKVQKLVYQLPFVPIIYIEICVIEVPESKVSKIFCSSTPTTLMIRRRPIVVNGGGFVVTDLSNNVVFIVDGCGTLGSKGELLVKDGEGEPILFISRKVFQFL
ncbi:hypothetical protein GUJ93_ZPchr0004g38346 [Zizania palustris]|uniref:Uncharacterized protein n=1 Tax=Zizania palustris TaxID=103762 RepID=A0A8J5V8Q7_ZIZPA|nr:hypothetical protein GUJ93_ZPchr0004g38346 [Zizania palustris]